MRCRKQLINTQVVLLEAGTGRRGTAGRVGEPAPSPSRLPAVRFLRHCRPRGGVLLRDFFHSLFFHHKQCCQMVGRFGGDVIRFLNSITHSKLHTKQKTIDRRLEIRRGRKVHQICGHRCGVFYGIRTKLSSSSWLANVSGFGLVFITCVVLSCNFGEWNDVLRISDALSVLAGIFRGYELNISKSSTVYNPDGV